MHRHVKRLALMGLVSGVLSIGQPDPGSSAQIELIGTGIVPGTATDGLKLVPKTLEDGTPHDRVGGFGSAITYTGFGNFYAAVPDRGPNDGQTSYLDRAYLFYIAVTPGAATTVKVVLDTATLLRNETGAVFTGSTAAFDATNSPASLRLDPEGIRVGRDGTFFVSDEYGPFVYEFSGTGQRLRSLAVPAKFLIAHPSAAQPAEPTGELPPTNTAGRQANRGMEGLAITPDGKRLYGIMQNALIQDGALNASTQRRGLNNRILEIDLETGATRELLYRLDVRNLGVNEILAINDHEFLVIERDGSGGAAATVKKIFKIDITGADDISGIATLPETAIPDKLGMPGVPVTPVSKTLFIDLLADEFGLKGATFPEKVEGLAFGPPLPDGRRLLLVASDNDFFATLESKIFAFAIEPAALLGWQPQTVDTRLAVLSEARLWLGLKNSDDQGTRFDVRVQIKQDGVVLAEGESRCIAGVTRNPNKALAVRIPIAPIPGAVVGESGNVTVTVEARIGTSASGAACPGHAGARGLRMYYDSEARAARTGEFYLHSGGGDVFDTIIPAGTHSHFKDSAPVRLSGGNAWQPIGTWTVTPTP